MICARKTYSIYFNIKNNEVKKIDITNECNWSCLEEPSCRYMEAYTQATHEK